MKSMKWMLWHEWYERIERNELKWMNETNELKWKNWNQQLDTNELKRMIWKELIAKNAPIPSVLFAMFIGNRALATVSRTFCRPHRPRVVWDRQFFTIIYDNMWSTTWWQCGWHMRPSSRYTCCRPHLQKVVRGCQFVTNFMWNRALATVACTCVDHFPDRGAQPQKQRPSSGDQGRPLYRKKNTGFRARKCFQPWIHTFPSPHTRWCGWHDGATASCDNRS